MITQIIGASLASFYLYQKIGLALLPNGHRYQILFAVWLVSFMLISLEVSKRVCVHWAFRSVFKRIILLRGNRWPYFTGIGATSCMALSMLTSAFGSQLYTLQLKDTSPQIEAHYAQKREAVKASFEEDITRKKAIIYALETRGRNRRWGLTDNETKSLSLGYDAIESLRVERSDAIAQLNDQEKNAIKKAKATLKTSLVPVVAFALFLEALTLSCLGYCEYYKARIFKEELPEEKNRTVIRNKYPKLVKDLVKSKRGRRSVPVKELSKIHGVSSSTIQRVKQEMSL